MVLYTSRTQHCPKLFPPQGINIEIWFWNHFPFQQGQAHKLQYNGWPRVHRSGCSKFIRRVIMILHEKVVRPKIVWKMKRRILRFPCSISEAPNKTNSPPPRLVANKSFSPVWARTQFPKISNTNLIIERVHEVCSFEKSNFHLKSICQKVRLNLWQLGLLDFGRTTKYFQQLSQQNREIQSTPTKGLWSHV